MKGVTLVIVPLPIVLRLMMLLSIVAYGPTNLRACCWCLLHFSSRTMSTLDFLDDLLCAEGLRDDRVVEGPCVCCDSNFAVVFRRHEAPKRMGDAPCLCSFNHRETGTPAIGGGRSRPKYLKRAPGASSRS